MKFRYLTKITNSAIDIYLELDALENMFVRVASRLGLALLFLASFSSKVIKSEL